MENQSEQRDLEAARAALARNTVGHETPGRSEPPSEGVLTLICETCGKYYFFDDAPPPAGLICEKCRGTVFREFFTPVSNSEAAEDFEDTTSRDLGMDEPNPDTLPGDLIDLNKP